jgi:N-acetylglucosamine-6-phosphate deacetylase
VSRFRLDGRDPATGRGVSLEAADGRIVSVCDAACAEDVYIAPGLVDMQVNGYAGFDLNPGDSGATPDVVAALVEAVALTGVTTFLPTLVTAGPETLLKSLAAIREARRDPVVARAIPFVHVEGPWISPADGPRGAHPAAHVRDPDLAEFKAWQEAAGDLVGMVTLCPARPGAPDAIAALAGQGVRVAIGHSDATSEQIREAARAGASLSTHLGNGVAAVLPRHPNAIWTQLAEDALTATFIADGHHLPVDALKAMVRAKGLARAALVSDCVALAGSPPGVYDSAIGGRVRLSEDGRLSVEGTPYLAGAARPLKDCVATAAGPAGFGLADALSLATKNPGRIVGGRGSLSPGMPADAIRFRYREGDSTLTLLDVVRGGAAL